MGISVTFISDTHNKHEQIDRDTLPGGDILIHAGDVSSMGYVHEVHMFLRWFDSISGYDNKIFIAGNHDWFFEQQGREMINKTLETFPNITYLMDESVEVLSDNYVDNVKIYGSPWQPWFRNWAFNLPRGGDELKEKWEEIPNDTDILITHGPPKGILDLNPRDNFECGCERLEEIIWKKKPKIHVFGHIHSQWGHKEINGIHFFNAAVLSNRYNMDYEPINIEWDWENNKVEFL